MAKKNQPKRNKKPVKKAAVRPKADLPLLGDIHFAMTRKNAPPVFCACGFEKTLYVTCVHCGEEAKADMPLNVTDSADCSVPAEKELKDMHSGWLVENMIPQASKGPFDLDAPQDMKKVTIGSLSGPAREGETEEDFRSRLRFQLSEDAVARDWAMAPANQVTPLYSEASHQTLTAACRAISGYGDDLPLEEKLSLEEKERRIKVLEGIVGDPAHSMLGLAAMYSADPVKNLGFVEASDWNGLRESLKNEREQDDPIHVSEFGLRAHTAISGALRGVSFNPVYVPEKGKSAAESVTISVNTGTGREVKVVLDPNIPSHAAAIKSLRGNKLEFSIRPPAENTVQFMDAMAESRKVAKAALVKSDNLCAQSPIIDLVIDKDDPDPVVTVAEVIKQVTKEHKHIPILKWEMDGEIPNSLYPDPLGEALREAYPPYGQAFLRVLKQLGERLKQSDEAIQQAAAEYNEAIVNGHVGNLEEFVIGQFGMREIVSYDPEQDKCVVKLLPADDPVFDGWK